MNICFVVVDISVVGGVERVTVNLANEFSNMHNVRILSLLGTKNAIPYETNERIEFDSLDCKAGRLREEYKEVRAPLIQYLNDKSIDIAIFQGHFTAFICSSIKGKVKAKMIFCDHGALMNSWNIKKTVLCRLIAAMRCDHLVTLTERSMKDYNSKLLIPLRKITCIPNWIDENIERSNHYDADSKGIIWVGRLSEEKGVNQLIEAYALIASDYPEWHLDLYGDGDERTKLEKMATDLGIESRVIFKGSSNEIMKEYQKYAFFVLPSYKEGYPVVLLEAKFNRLPIVSFDILTGPREIIRDGIDGKLVPECNINEFASAMRELMDSKELREEMSRRSQDNIDNMYSNKVCGKWNSLFARMTSK